jgi:hypothetical protein
MTTQSSITTIYVGRQSHELSERDVAILESLAIIRFATTRQLQRLHVYDGTPLGNARVAARILKRLADQHILIRMPRQVGGVRAGSASIVFTLARPAIALLNQGTGTVRTPTLPGYQYMAHALSVTELYVGLKELECLGTLAVKTFQVEPKRLVTYSGRKLLRPDAYIRVRMGGFVYYWFIEMDLSTERRPQLKRKLDAYIKYWESGRERSSTGKPVFPKVLFLVPDRSRKTVFERLIEHVPSHARRLFRVELIKDAMEILGKERG